jgi:hypothetical protein
MSAAEVARRLEARATGPQAWKARCPAHEDRRPSLSIREGRDGRTLVRCFAGCEPDAIVRAVGLRVRDLFDKARHSAAPAARRGRERPLRADEVERALRDELQRILADDAERTGFPAVAVLTCHRNKARDAIERRFGIALRHEGSPWWEIDPHAIDPAWRQCVEDALDTVAAYSGVDPATLRLSIDDLPETQICALKIARRFQARLAQGAAAQVAG